MKILFTSLRLLLLLSLSTSVVYADNQQTELLSKTLTVYKNPQCGCCGKWVDYMQKNRFTSKVVNLSNLGNLKAQYGISPRYRSCHTAVWNQGKYIFEGHVPADVIKQFLANPPKDAIGLTVPGMPLGSPGMEVGNRRMAYQVLLLKKDGSVTTYADIPGNE